MGDLHSHPATAAPHSRDLTQIAGSRSTGEDLEGGVAARVRPTIDEDEVRLIPGDVAALDRAVELLVSRAALRRPGHPRRRDLLAASARLERLARPGPVGRVR